MRERMPYILRAVTIAVFVLVLLLVVRLVVAGGDDSSQTSELVEPVVGSISVSDAINGPHPDIETLAVRGFLFEGGGTGVRLCPRRKPGKPPVCIGPFLDVYGLDTTGLPFRRGTFLGRNVRWLDEPVTVYGTVLGTALNAKSVSR